MGHAQSRRMRQNPPHLPAKHFPDLREFPPEVAMAVLANLNATDLCLAACVWNDLAGDDILWKKLCHEKWGYVSWYSGLPSIDDNEDMTFKQAYLLLDEATLFFTYEPQKAVQYLIDNGILVNEPMEIAKMLDGSRAFYTKSLLSFLSERHDVLEEFVRLQNYSNVFLSDAMRQFFKKIPPPKQRGEFFEILMDKFCTRYYQCNQNSGISKDGISVLSYSLLLLSVDLYSPHVKNKMSKREFIRNNRQIVVDINRDLLGDLYDDLYLNGPIAVTSLNVNMKLRQPFRPYGVLFELKPWNVQSCC